MFKRNGICYHTGYKPKPYVSPPKVPEAILRMHRFMADLRAKGRE